MSLRKALLAATVLALPMAAAQAQPVSGLYVGAGAGVNFRHDSESRGVSMVPAATRLRGCRLHRLGLRQRAPHRVRGQLPREQVDKLTLEGTPAVRSSSGNIRTYGAMGNILFDFNLFNSPTWMTYIGGGAGYVWNDWKNGRFIRGTTTYRIDDDDPRFAYQGIAGVAFNIAPGLALTAEYRFLGTLNPKIGIDRIAGPQRADVAAGFKPENFNHSALLGLRLNFGVRRRPGRRGAGAAARAGDRPHLPRLLRLGSADLTDRARQIIAEAANNSAPRRVHADRGGRPRRPLRHAAVQPAPVAAPRRRCRGGTRPQGVNRERHRRHAPMARAGRWSRPPTACASRRTVASRSCSARRGETRRTASRRETSHTGRALPNRGERASAVARPPRARSP